MSSSYVIGFDVGGTRLKSGGVTRDGTIFAMDARPSGFMMVPDKLLAAMAEEVERIQQEAGALPAGIGLAFPGGVDPNFGVVLLPGKIKGLEGFPIVEKLSSATGLPVICDNDGRVSIFAEKYYGLAANHDWAVTITIGTGVGSGVMLDGKILRDPHLQFGTQLSHTVLDASNPSLCITTARGTAEMLCSATALALGVRSGLQRGLQSILSDQYFEDAHSVDFKAVIEAVEAGDRLCQDELRIWTERVGWLLVNAVHAYAPEIIILSGGATNAAHHFLDNLRTHVNSHIYRYPTSEPVPVELSQIREHSGVLGTAALVWDKLEE